MTFSTSIKQAFLSMTTFLVAILLYACSPAKVITIHTIGDSTMADYNENVTATRGWGEMLPHFVKPSKAVVANYARGGRSSKSFYEEHLWQSVLDSIRPGDFVLIQFAHNDEKENGLEGSDGRGTSPWLSYRLYLERYVDQTRAKNATPVFIAPIIRRYFDSSDHITRKGQHDLSPSPSDTTLNYIRAMQYVAHTKNVPYVDLTSRSLQLIETAGPILSKQIYYVSTDNTHTQAYGAASFAYAAMSEMRNMNILPKVWCDRSLLVNPLTVNLGDVFVGNNVQYTFDAIYLNDSPLEKRSYSISTTDSLGLKWANTHPLSFTSSSLYADTLGAISFTASFTPTTLGPVEKHINVSSTTTSQTITIKANAIQPSETHPASIHFTSLNGKPESEHYIHCSSPSIKGLKLLPTPSPSNTPSTTSPSHNPSTSPSTNPSTTPSTSPSTSPSTFLSTTTPSTPMTYIIPEEDSWPADIDESGTRYIEFYIIPLTTTSFSEISLTTDSDLCYRIATSRNKDFASRTTIGECLDKGHPESMTFHTATTISPQERLIIRIYPWSKSSTTTPFHITDISVKGTAFK